MRQKAYPLEALRKIRGAAQDAAVSALREARAQLAEAGATHAAAERSAAASAERRVAATRVAAVSGADLAIAGAYAARLHAEYADKRATLQRTAAEVRRRDRGVQLAELQLRQAYIERELVERHHARFVEEERKRRQRAEDDEMDDLIPHLPQLRRDF